MTSSVVKWLAGSLFVLSLAASGASGQEAGSFQIETITVEGGRRAATQGIVIAASRLTVGREWSERELREAVYRIRRLPFIVHADFALRKGTARGLYALVITVEETRPFFFFQDAEIVWLPKDAAALALGYGEKDAELQNSGTAGARLFLGARNAVFAAVDTREGLQAGTTLFDLFGRGGVLSLTVGHHFVCCRIEVVPLGLDPGFVTWTTKDGDSASLSLQVPLEGSHSLRGGVTLARRDASSRESLLDHTSNDNQLFGGSDRLTSRQAELKWFYDTADDPLFPTRGVTLSGGVELNQISVPLRSLGTLPLEPADIQSDARMAALAVTGRETWSLSARQSLSLGGRVAAGRSRIDHLLMNDGTIRARPTDLDTFEASIEARYSASLWGFERSRNLGDLRFELAGRFGEDTTSPAFGGPVRQLSFGPSVAFRNGWGVFRFGLAYLDFQRSSR
jgi:hypothetical protein